MIEPLHALVAYVAVSAPSGSNHAALWTQQQWVSVLKESLDNMVSNSRAYEEVNLIASFEESWFCDRCKYEKDHHHDCSDANRNVPSIVFDH